jgi:hypothetical protein
MERYDAYIQDKRQNVWDKFWRDRKGRVVVWQTPNVWLIAWAVCLTLSLFLGGHVGDALFWVASAALVIWSLLEIFLGAAYVRRLLGLVVLLYAVATILKSL